jgi:RimJ/RimL family protein N-acetyltransferase
MKLIAINENGTPAEPLGPLPQLACDVCEPFRKFYNSQGFTPPWTGYLAEQDEVIVGSCGFKGAPADNRVEIAYFTFPEFEGRGLATQMARHLVDIALATSPEVTVAAQTLPEESASTAILRKLGFILKETLIHPEDGQVWEWVYQGRTRPRKLLKQIMPEISQKAQARGLTPEILNVRWSPKFRQVAKRESRS